MQSNYLTINGLEFKQQTIHSGNLYNLLPSSITPQLEIIKTCERALSGKMHVDITGTKMTLTITFEMLSDHDFIFLRNFISFEKIENINADGFEICYFDFLGSRQEKKLTCFVDSVNYMPFIIGNDLIWRDITIVFIEI